MTKFFWFLYITFTSALSLASGENIVKCTNVWGWITFTFDCGAIEDKVLHSEYFDQHTNIYCEVLKHKYMEYTHWQKENISFSDATEIVFTNCELPYIPHEFFQQLGNAKKIVLNDSAVDIIDNGKFADGSSLKTLYMSYNNLIELPAFLFSHTPDILEIDFSHNRIQFIDPDTFSGSAKNVMKINLSHNQIKAVERLLFTDLIYLRLLDLSHNLIEVFEVDVHPLTQLSFLYLKDNRIKQLNCNIFANQIFIDVSMNQLQEIDLTCNLTFLGELTGANGLTLNLNDNDLEKLSFPSTRLVKKLTTVYAARNKIKTLFADSVLYNLRILTLASNNLSNFSNFFDYTNSLTTLDLSFNDIQSIRPNLFSNIPLLQLLYLQNTNLSKIDHGTFSHQRHLIALDLSHNKLKKINFDLFLPYFQYLLELHLNNNNLTDIVGWEDSLFPQLRILAIANNDFNCSFLSQFLRLFKSPKIYLLPSFPTHINGRQSIHGISCIDTKTNSFEIFDDYSNSSLEDKPILGGISNSKDFDATINNQILIDKVSQYMSSMKSILIVLCFICLAPVVIMLVKSLNILNFFKRFNSFERHITNLRNNDSFLHSSTTINTVATNV